MRSAARALRHSAPLARGRIATPVVRGLRPPRESLAPRRFATQTPASEGTLAKWSDNLANKFQNMTLYEVHHSTSYALVGLTPVALALSPSLLNFPVDLALGIVLPIHAHIGMQGVVEDYVPRGTLRAGAKIGVAVLTVTTLLGLMKLNLCGPGLTESVKSLWRDPAAKKSA